MPVKQLALISQLAILCSVIILLSSPASAQSVGVRAGASVDPDQFFLGGHYETGAIADRVTFRPNVEVGIGHDITLVGLNFELLYKFPTSRPWGVYAGGGPALNIFWADGDHDAEGGFNFLVGAEHRGGLFGEIKFGVLDSPDFRITIGYSFH